MGATTFLEILGILSTTVLGIAIPFITSSHARRSDRLHSEWHATTETATTEEKSKEDVGSTTIGHRGGKGRRSSKPRTESCPDPNERPPPESCCHGHGVKAKQTEEEREETRHTHPVVIQRGDDDERRENLLVILSFANSFAGGVILATGVVHVLSDASRTSIEIYGEEAKLAFVLPNILCVIGVLIPFFIEKSGLVIWIAQHGICSPNRIISFAPLQMESVTIEKSETTKLLDVDYSSTSQTFAFDDPKQKPQENEIPAGSKCVVPSITSVRLQNKVDMLHNVGSSKVLAHADMICKTGNEEPLLIQDEKSGVSKMLYKHNHLSFATILMVTVLSIHSFLAGLTLGAVRSTEGTHSSRVHIYWAFLVHKVFEALALGVQASQHEITSQVVLQLVSYILATPAGMVLGAFLNVDESWQVVLLGLTAGIFIWLALVETLGEEFEQEEFRVAKFVCFALGCALISGLAVWT